MAYAMAMFDAYKLWYYSSYAGTYPFDALIYCYKGTTFVGRIEFRKAEASIDALRSEITNGQPFVRYRIDRFRDVHQLLLHEKPLYLFVNDANWVGGIGTAENEPTGEEE
jgi:hypothetical protein